MVPRFSTRVLGPPSTPTEISPFTVSSPAEMLPTVTPPFSITRLFAVATVAPWMVAVVLLVIVASSAGDGGTPRDQLAGVNQPALPEIQLLVTAQAQSLQLPRKIANT